MAPRQVSAANHGIPIIPISLLLALLAFAFDSMFGQLSRNGYLALLDSLVDPPAGASTPRQLPGSTRQIVDRYTGIAPIDRFLVTGNVFFANVADGSAPGLSLLALQFGGQLLAALAIVLVEAGRAGSARNVIRGAIVWALLIQLAGFGLVMPLFCISHLLLLPSASVRVRDYVHLRSAIPALLFGYVFIAVLSAYPFEYLPLRQYAVAAWQIFPLLIVLYQFFFAEAAKRVSVGGESGTPRLERERRALGSVYQFVLVVGTVLQWTSYAVSVAAIVNPSIFPEDLAKSLTPDKVFIPGSPHSYGPMASPAAAIHQFLLYDQYVGCAALIVWASTLASRADQLSIDVAGLVGIMRNCVLVGPAGAAVLLLWRRDDALLSAAKATTRGVE